MQPGGGSGARTSLDAASARTSSLSALNSSGSARAGGSQDSSGGGGGRASTEGGYATPLGSAAAREGLPWGADGGGWRVRWLLPATLGQALMLTLPLAAG